MKTVFTFILALATCTAFTVSAYAQKGGAASGGARIAVADLEKIAKELPEAKEADKRLTDVRGKVLDTLKMFETRFKDKLEAYNKGKAMMTADAQKKEEEDLRNLQQQYGMYQEQMLGASGELARMRDSMLKPILARIQEVVEQIAKEEGYNFVFDKGAQSVLMYADAKADITFKVIDRLLKSK
ncbi:MAG: OmpH family outer membrane protein [Candidatus Kapabacteria bacterium]|nr:OmpH family outer membrane protein [Candidatus Kapabacteria bacterium]